MARFRILYLAGGILENTEVFPTDNVVAAAKHAAGLFPKLTAEVWSGHRKVAIVGPCPISRFAARRRTGKKAARNGALGRPGGTGNYAL